ncbi:CoA-transferase subunit beta [Sciscionella marina]|uniref:CoA-transferase subunit beta n=1 Tax=Sciscionella marina TaxID=508770 RepID=UPI0003666F5D|nr:CoA-transferase [Sciscionella marina]
MTTIQAPVTPRELLVFEGARQIGADERIIAGTGLPLLAALLAQRTTAPGLKLIIESGVVFPEVVPTPISVVDPRIMHSPSRLGSLLEVLGGFVQRGLVTTGFLGGAQIDARANLNSSWIRRGAEWVRLPGSGGANDIGSHCAKVVVLTTHEKRRFPQHCDYVTTPGFLDGPGGRERAGLGPLSVRVITDLCVFSGDETTGELELTALMPGVEVEDVLENTGFRPRIAAHPRAVTEPEEPELRLLREELDPRAKYFPERRTP